MKKTYTLPALWMLCLLLLGSQTFVGCNNGDEEDTNQYKGGISLSVFGPSPVARGGTLRFLGSGMDRVTAVSIPGSEDITDIEVVSSTEIRVTVPQTAMPGRVTLRTPNGDITTITGLTFTEPIDIESFAPATIKPGSQLTINGEYLNLIKEIIFAEEVTVPASDFVSQSRKQIQVMVPESAQTGKFILSDGGEIPNWIYSESEVQVTLPSVEAVATLANKKPGDIIELSGSDFDLIKKVQMPNGDEVKFTVADNKLSFTLPQNISDGEILILPASEVKVPVASITVAVPTVSGATPAAGLRGGDVITLKGQNLELVTNITFPSVADAVALQSQTTTQITVTMPAAATSGELTLNTLSGKSARVTIATAKPANLAYSAASVPAGRSLTITGTNLDVVSEVLFAGGVAVPVSGATATAVTLTVPTTAESGALTLNMANGETVTAPTLTVEKPVCAYLPALPDKLVRGKIVELEIANADKLTRVELNGSVAQYINDTSKNILMLNVPANLEGTYVLKLISSNGEISYNVLIVPNEEIVWKGPLTITWGVGGRVIIPAAMLDKVATGTVMRVYFDQINDEWGQAHFMYGNWDGIAFAQFDKVLVPTDLYGWSFASRVLDLVLTQEILTTIKAKKGEVESEPNTGIVIQGSNLIFQKIALVN